MATPLASNNPTPQNGTGPKVPRLESRFAARPRLALVACPYEFESSILPLLEQDHLLDCRSIDVDDSVSSASIHRQELACVYAGDEVEQVLERINVPAVVVGRRIGQDQMVKLISLGAHNVYDLSKVPAAQIARLLTAHAVAHLHRQLLSDPQGADPERGDASAYFAVIEWDRDLKIIRWSDEAETLLGIPKTEAEGRPLGKWLLPTEEMVSFVSGCQSLASGVLGNYKGNCRVRRSDGTALDANWKVTPAGDGSKTFIAIFELGSSSSNALPQVDRVQAASLHTLQVEEPPAKKYAAATSRSDAADYTQRAEFLANAVEQLSIGVYLKEEQGNQAFTVWNAQMERLFQVGKKEVLGKRMDEIFGDPLLRRILGEAKLPHSRSRAIMPRSTQAGNDQGNFIADITKTPICDEKGRPIAVIGIVHDVTERIHSENRLVAAFNELEASKEKLEKSNLEIRKGIEKAKKLAVAAQASNKAKSFFLSNISHELRTPLTSIVSLTHALLEGTFGPMNPKQKEYLEIVSDSSKHLQALITDILDLSKIELGKLNLKLARTPIVEIAQASIRMVMQQAQTKNVQCELQIKSEVDAIDVDAKRLRQVLLNLLFNAVKFTRPDTTISLTIESNKRDDVVVFSVRDEGIGIQEVDIEKIFTPFTQLDDSLSKQYEGTGLGLAIVSKLVELHGGGLSVRSRADEGAVFSIVLPVEQPVDIDEPHGITLAEIAASDPQAPLIIVVEENDRLACQMLAAMARLDYPQAVVAMPNELSAYYDQISPIAIIADLATITTHGTDWIPAAQNHPNWTRAHWIATSSLDIEASRQLTAKLNFHTFAPKPITNSVFNSIVQPIE